MTPQELAQMIWNIKEIIRKPPIKYPYKKESL